MRSSFHILICIEMRVAAEQQERKKGRMGEKYFPSSSRVTCNISEILKVSENGGLEIQVIKYEVIFYCKIRYFC